MTSSPSFESAIAHVLEEFIAHKEAMGLNYQPHRLIFGQLDRFLSELGAPDLTSETFTKWCSSIEHLSANGRRLRLQNVRRLCLFRRRTEPDCFVPQRSLFPLPKPPPRPHIFTEDEIALLLRSADELPAYRVSPLYPQVARLSVVLLYTAGLRRGELARLTLGDFDPVEHVLLIRETKFHKSRIVPLSPDAAREMGRYLEVRRRPAYPAGADTPLLLHRQRGLSPYSGNGLRILMRTLFKRAGIRTVDGRLPRTHDLRFTFAVHALTRWYRTGADVQSRLPSLAIYMGHVSIVSTQYYLGLVDAVARSASELFERHGALVLDARTNRDRGER